MGERVCCPECGSSRIKQSRIIAEVQRVYKEPRQDGSGYIETGTGKKHCYFIYNCFDCGNEFYEKIREGLVN
jgi:hypothetical protein